MRVLRASLIAALAIIAAACSSEPVAAPGTEPVVTEPAPASTTTRPAETIESTTATTGAGAQAEAAATEDLARFVAAAEAAIDGTPAEGLVLEEPDIHIALAQTACARFSQGASFDAVVDELIGSAANQDYDQTLIGAVIGAAVETICPEHSNQI